MGLAEYLPIANVAVHVIGSIMFVYSVYFNYFHVNIPAEITPIFDAYGGKFKYLTFIDGVRNTKHIHTHNCVYVYTISTIGTIKYIYIVICHI